MKSRRAGCIAGILVLSVTALTGWSQTTVSGPIAADTLWTVAGSPYRITGHVTLNAGVTLTIQPGVQVEFAQHIALYINGHLRAEGTGVAPVVFMGTSETPGSWRGIHIQNAGSAAFEHCRVIGAGYWDSVGVSKTGSGDLTVRHTTIRDTLGDGLRIVVGSGSFVHANNTYVNNHRGIRLGINLSFDDITSTFAGNGIDLLLEGGTIDRPVTWNLNPASSLYLSGHFTVAAGATLTIVPGTVVKFAQHHAIFVDGHLEARGTAAAPIHFTDWRDDTVGGDANKDGDSTVPGPAWWRGVQVRNNGSATIEHCRIAYAGHWDSVGVWKTGTGALTLRSTTIRNTAGDGLRIAAGSSALNCSNNTYANNNYEVRLGIDLSFDDTTSVFAGNPVDVFLDGGTLDRDITWRLTPAYSLYLSSSITVTSDATLTILPGTSLKLAQPHASYIYGRLDARGTPTAPIHFTDERDDSVGGDLFRDGADRAPGPGWWRGIQMHHTGSAVFEHGHITYAGHWDGIGMAKSGSGDLSLTRCTFANQAGTGLLIADSTGDHTLVRDAFSGHNTGLLGRNQAESLVLSGNRFEGNTGHAVLNQNSVEIDARGNWWGHASGPRHPTLNPEGQGDPVCDGVHLDSWRTTTRACAATTSMSPVREPGMSRGCWAPAPPRPCSPANPDTPTGSTAWPRTTSGGVKSKHPWPKQRPPSGLRLRLRRSRRRAGTAIRSWWKCRPKRGGPTRSNTRTVSTTLSGRF